MPTRSQFSGSFLRPVCHPGCAADSPRLSGQASCLWRRQQSLCFFSFPDGLSYLAADAFFKAAISLIPEVPKTISIDGKMRPSEPFLLEFLCNFFSTLLIVPVRPPRELKVSVSDLLTWASSALSMQGVLSVLVCSQMLECLSVFPTHFVS